MSGIHLFVPMLHRHDAVGEHTVVLRDRLQARGLDSRIYSEIPDPDTAHETLPYVGYAEVARPGDVLVYQFATASPMAQWLADRPEVLVLNYHSLTPPDYFRPWNADIARGQWSARRELTDLASRADLGVAVSRFDADELRDAGCRRVEVVPVAGVRDPPVEPDASTLERLARLRGSGASWLSVGRLAPNKGHEWTLAALRAARSSCDPGAHLTVVGAPSEPHYAGALRRFAAVLGLSDSVDFVTGLDDAELSAYYRAADVLVMLSEHEGFGVPLLEAMGHDVPVVAFRSGAVAETAGDAAVLLDARSPHRVAEAVTALLSDGVRRDQLRHAGRRRRAALRLDGAADRFGDLVVALAGPPAPTA